MHALRNAHFIARLVLVWFALSLGVAVASPLVAPKSMELVCSSAGAVKWVFAGDDSPRTAQGHSTLDCPLCASLSAPPAVVPHAAQPPLTPSQVRVPVAVTRMAVRMAAPWQARAPPALS